MASYVARPSKPAPALAGYIVAVRNATLSAQRCDLPPAGAMGGSVSCRDLATFDLQSLENGVVVGAWNMLRVVVEGGRLRVWFNPMFPETGFVGDGVADAARVPKPLPPRIDVVDPHAATVPVPAGGFAVSAGESPVLLDYASALPANVLQLGKS